MITSSARNIILLLSIIIGWIGTASSSLDIIVAQVLILEHTIFLFQAGFLLSIPGVLQLMLEKGTVRGLYTYVMNAVILMIYAMFQMMNTCFYFHYGFTTSAKYIASGRVTGLEHKSIVEIYRTFKDTHFVSSSVLLFVYLLGLIVGGTVEFLIFNSVFIVVLLWGPFLFNAGSYPFFVSYETWVKLFSANLALLKQWIRTQCDMSKLEMPLISSHYIEEVELDDNTRTEIIDEKLEEKAKNERVPGGKSYLANSHISLKFSKLNIFAKKKQQK
jgi:hypothetical protein